MMALINDATLVFLYCLQQYGHYYVLIHRRISDISPVPGSIHVVDCFQDRRGYLHIGSSDQSCEILLPGECYILLSEPSVGQ